MRANKEMPDGSMFTVEWTDETWYGDGFNNPDEYDVLDEHYYIDGQEYQAKDLPDEYSDIIEEVMCNGGVEIPYNFGEPSN